MNKQTRIARMESIIKEMNVIKDFIELKESNTQKTILISKLTKELQAIERRVERFMDKYDKEGQYLRDTYGTAILKAETQGSKIIIESVDATGYADWTANSAVCEAMGSLLGYIIKIQGVDNHEHESE